MFVIINSTPTRINKSHLVDLYERVSWADADRRFAARLVDSLYTESDSPLRYRINRLGGRSQLDKWILQAELFNELHRWASRDWRRIQLVFDGPAPDALLRSPGIVSTRREGRTLTLVVSSGAELTLAEARSLGPVAADLTPVALKEIFLQSAGEEK